MRDAASSKIAAGTSAGCEHSKRLPGRLWQKIIATSKAKHAGNAGLLITTKPADSRSMIYAAATGVGYFLLAAAILLPQDQAILAVGFWPPNACVVALLLIKRLRGEAAVLTAVMIAGWAALLASGFTPGAGAIMSLANTAEIAVAVALTRYLCGPAPDLARLGDLSRFLWAGGVVAPLISTTLASPTLGADLETAKIGAITWLLTGSMAMVLIVPAGLLLLGRGQAKASLPLASLGQTIVLLLTGTVCALLLFGQSALPLLFLIPPITLLHAVRLGPRSAAVYVLVVALIAGVMTFLGHGPIAAATSSDVTRLLILQLFVSANLLTGLPVAAILAARNAMFLQMAEGKRQLDILAENIGDAVLHYNLHQICTYASPSVAEVLGAPAQNFIGKPVSARLHPETKAAVGDVLSKLYAGAAENARLTYRRWLDDEHGQPVYLEADCRVARDADGATINGVVVAVRNVTQRVELEALLTAAREQAEQVAKLKSDFLANMSHEIRTPMNGVLGFAEMMLQDDLPPKQRRFAELIVQSGRSMMMLLNDILDLSKIEAGQFTIDESPVDICATLAECAALHRADAERKGLSLHLEYCGAGRTAQDHEEAGCHWIMTDGLRLRQIILNLVGNAVKFTLQGSITLRYELAEDAVMISVEDTGIGIAANRLDHIFTPFHQCDADISRQFGGTGLGLSISRKLADLMGGRITVTSRENAGSRFVLTLPAQLTQPHEQARRPAYPATPMIMPPAARVLLAEDHDVNRLLMSEMLERCGQTVAIAYDGSEAISMVIESIIRGRAYDLVLMDVQMPICDGYAAARAIRSEGISPDVLPIIALSANAFPTDIAAARAAGMQAHLAKPVMMADLARTLQRWLPTRIIDAAAQEPSAAKTPRVHAASTGPVPSPITAKTWAQWIEHRDDAIAAVAAAFSTDNPLPPCRDGADSRRLLMLMHNLAGTAASFGEPDLGRCAAALEDALRNSASPQVCEALACDLLSMRDKARQGSRKLQRPTP